MSAETETNAMGSDAFIVALYEGLLNRSPDAVGLESFQHMIDGGVSLAEIMRLVVNSQEFREQQAASNYHATPPAPSGTPAFSDYSPPPDEAGRSYARRLQSGFLNRYCAGEQVLDVGFSGYDNPDRKTALPHAIGIDLNYPGYDGRHLPFEDGSVDTVFSSHCLEHIADDHAVIQDWFRVLKIGGFIVCMVPHQALYEKKDALPSDWNMDHKRMYTPASLLASFETALETNSYRVRHLADNDEGFNYALGPGVHSDGAYEIELVIQKIEMPSWTLATSAPEDRPEAVGRTPRFLRWLLPTRDQA
ncbi:methyltransferase domain-containing protein [Sphingobium sp. AN558]|uniref:methyltransferase domain-containing protein n=1 Tax=Sphingobium sp. AN558 TaxID=3133442 RepID=UPI0030BF5DA3